MKRKCLDTESLLKQSLKVESNDDPNAIDLPSARHCQEYFVEHVIEENSNATESDSESSEHKHLAFVKTRRKRSASRKLKVGSPRSKNKKPETHDYRCFICEKVFDLISAKDFHVKQDHADVRICRICSKRKQTAISLETHLRYHFFGYRFLCSSCGKSFRFKNLLENHLKVEHYNTVKFACDLCVYATKFKINLERHVKVSSSGSKLNLFPNVQLPVGSHEAEELQM